MSDATSLPVRHLFTIEAKVDEPAPHVIAGPLGTRVVVSVNGGTFRGERLSGTVPPGAGGDWAVFRPDGTLRLDVRLTLITDDGVHLFITYNGAGKPNADGTLALRTAPTFEAPDGAYAWLNSVQAVGMGESNPATGSLRYEVYELL